MAKATRGECFYCEGEQTFVNGECSNCRYKKKQADKKAMLELIRKGKTLEERVALLEEQMIDKILK